jgi:excisionase family DNA binding protein
MLELTQKGDIMKPMGRLLRAAECAVKLSIRESTIRKMILEGRIDVVRIGRSVRIPETCVEDMIAKGFSAAKVR